MSRARDTEQGLRTTPPGPPSDAAIRPNFKKCGACGADAEEFCSWNPADGWCCLKCGGCDGDE